jgi:hypothetical protein
VGAPYLILRSDPGRSRRVVGRARTPYQAHTLLTDLVQQHAAALEAKRMTRARLEATVTDGTRCLDISEMDLYRRLRAIRLGEGPTADKQLLLDELYRRGLPAPQPGLDPAEAEVLAKDEAFWGPLEAAGRAAFLRSKKPTDE